jgi:S1-C subfamily serine protease
MPLPDQELLDAYSHAVVACVERTAPSVVSLSVWQDRRRRGEGSGLIVTPDGYILTNSHVVSGASSVVATFVDGEQVRGRVVGDDPATDLALVRVQVDQLPHAQLEVGPRPRPGQLAIAIGNPLGFDATVSSGVVSALGRTLNGPNGELIDDLIQHTAPLNPGNSGGPLLASDGRVLGINSAMAGHSQAIGFAIPVETAAWVVGELLARGKVQRAFLGIAVRTRPLPPRIKARAGIAQRSAVEIIARNYRGAAELADLRPQDLIIELAGKTVSDAPSLHRALRKVTPGARVHVSILRNGMRLERELVTQLGPGPAERRSRAVAS